MKAHILTLLVTLALAPMVQNLKIDLKKQDNSTKMDLLKNEFYICNDKLEKVIHDLIYLVGDFMNKDYDHTIRKIFNIITEAYDDYECFKYTFLNEGAIKILGKVFLNFNLFKIETSSGQAKNELEKKDFSKALDNAKSGDLLNDSNQVGNWDLQQNQQINNNVLLNLNAFNIFFQNFLHI